MRSLRTYVAAMTVLVVCSSLVSANDAVIAQQIAGKLRTQQQASQLQGFQIRVNVEDGNVWLKGEVADDGQRQLALELARRVPGVNVVVNDLRIQPVARPSHSERARAMRPMSAGVEGPWTRPVQPAIATAMSAAPATRVGVPTARPIARHASAAAPIVPRPVGASRMPERMASLQGRVISDRAVNGPGVAAGGCYDGNGCYGGSEGGGGYGNGGGYDTGGYGSGSGSGRYGGGYGGTAGTYDSPNMPGYAWPSYASHPNYAALTYPQQYSPTAWPYIGPFYPYPQVPLGWRKVALEWDDGWWFLDFSSK